MLLSPFKEVIYSVLLPLLSLFEDYKYTPRTTNIIKEEYDYIIVGAGSAGSTLAGRLSENPSVNVLLLEAGSNPSPLTEVPGLVTLFLRSSHAWKFFTVPLKNTGAGLNNRQLYFPLGKALGGSSVINAMLYVRGAHEVYDQWAAGGATGWSYKEVLPYFKKSERNGNPDSIDKSYHGFEGPMNIVKPTFEAKYRTAIKAGVEELGYNSIDVNGKFSKGGYDYQVNSINGRRLTSAKAYLVPVDNRKNLHIVKNALVTKILVENGKAVGVRMKKNIKTLEIKATREVIVAAGTINTPKLLMLSGIGPKEHLKEFKIPVIADLPVGLNLQDHAASFRAYYTDSMPSAVVKAWEPTSVLGYALNGTGLLSTPSFIQYVLFGTNDRNSPPDAVPDYELYFIDFVLAPLLFSAVTNLKEELVDRYSAPYLLNSQLICLANLLHPRSRGTVRLQSANIEDSPLIDPNYYDDRQDLIDVIEGMKECDSVANTSALRNLGVKPFATKVLGCEEYVEDRDAYLECIARTIVMTSWHPVGTAKMGRPDDPTTVVDPELRVKGIKGLRVVDGSVMPILTNGNTNNPIIMIAEKAADMIKNE